MSLHSLFVGPETGTAVMHADMCKLVISLISSGPDVVRQSSSCVVIIAALLCPFQQAQTLLRDPQMLCQHQCCSALTSHLLNPAQINAGSPHQHGPRAAQQQRPYSSRRHRSPTHPRPSYQPGRAPLPSPAQSSAASSAPLPRPHTCTRSSPPTSRAAGRPSSTSASASRSRTSSTCCSRARPPRSAPSGCCWSLTRPRAAGWRTSVGTCPRRNARG